MLSICSKKCYFSSSQSLFQALSLSESLPNMGGHNFEILLGSLLFFRRRDFDISGNIFLPQEMISLPILVYSQNFVNIIMIWFKCFRRFHLGTSMHWLMKGLLLFLCTVLWLKCGWHFCQDQKGVNFRQHCASDGFAIFLFGCFNERTNLDIFLQLVEVTNKDINFS